jgi:hypothetical protein
MKTPDEIIDAFLTECPQAAIAIAHSALRASVVEPDQETGEPVVNPYKDLDPHDVESATTEAMQEHGFEDWFHDYVRKHRSPIPGA